MKKFTYIISAIFVLLATSCSNELETNMQEGKLSFTSINASMADLPTSRAHLEGGGKVVWDNGDRVGIFSDTQTTPVMFECTNINESNASFTSENEVSGSNFFAYYPYENTTINGNTITYTLPNYAEYKPGTYFRQCPMIAKSTTNEFGFKHTCGIIRFSITGTQRIQSLVLEGNNGEIIAGTGTINLNAETPILAIPSDAADADKAITMTMDNLQLSSTATDFYFVVPEVTFTKGLSLRINYLNDDSSVTPIKKSTTKSISVSRSVIKSFSAIDTDTLVQEKEEETYAALMAFYNATGGDNWTNNTNWGSDKPFGEWYGLVERDGYVIWLQLPDNNLVGEIPEAIKSLQHLEGMSLRLNDITNIPTAIENMPRMEDLDLALCKISNFPEDMSVFKNIKRLWLSENKFDCEIPESIGILTKLELLELGNLDRAFDSSLPALKGRIPESIGNLTNLRVLNLSWNKLTGEIPTSLGNLVNLEQLVINANNLTGTVPTSVMQLDCWPYQWSWVVNQMGGNLSNEGLVIPGPKFNESTIDGEVLNESVYSKNEYTIFYYYESWCPYTLAFTPQLVDLYAGYKEKGLEVIAFSEQGTADDHRTFAETYHTQWPYITPPLGNLTFAAYRGVTPSVNVVDKDGFVVFNCVYDNYEDLDEFLLEKLGQPNDIENLDYYTSSDYSMDGTVNILQTAKQGNGIDIVLMGDAYSDRLIADGTYHTDMETVYSNLFAVEPYKTFKDYFNVYYVNVVSKNEIYTLNSSTKLEGYFGEGTEVGGKDVTCFTYAQKAISEERMDEALLIVVMNSSAYAGTCYMYSPTESGDYGSGITVSYFPKGSDTDTFAQLLHHEACGHGFAKLADEYSYEEQGTVPTDYVSQIQTEQSDWGWWKNVDFTNDQNSIRWSKFINDTRYANEGLGAYEGGLTYWTGVWRPTENSIMRYNTGGFNAPSREAIYYRIHKLAYGEEWQYDYEKFVEYDAINRNATATRAVTNFKQMPPLHEPVIIHDSWKNAKNNVPSRNTVPSNNNVIKQKTFSNGNAPSMKSAISHRITLPDGRIMITTHDNSGKTSVVYENK